MVAYTCVWSSWTVLTLHPSFLPQMALLQARVVEQKQFSRLPRQRKLADVDYTIS